MTHDAVRPPQSGSVDVGAADSAARMPVLPLILALIAALLALAVAAIVLARSTLPAGWSTAAAPPRRPPLAVAAIAVLLDAGAPEALRLPLGLPWIGAHFRLDALAAFFLVVVNVGGAAASLFALGYGRHEQAPGARAAVLSGVPRRHEPRRARRRRLHLPAVLGVHVAVVLGAGDGAITRTPTTRAPATSTS